MVILPWYTSKKHAWLVRAVRETLEQYLEEFYHARTSDVRESGPQNGRKIQVEDL